MDNNCNQVVHSANKQDQHGWLVFNVLKIGDLIMKADYLLRTSVDQPERMLYRPHKHCNVAVVIDEAPQLGILIQ